MSNFLNLPLDENYVLQLFTTGLWFFNPPQLEWIVIWRYTAYELNSTEYNRQIKYQHEISKQTASSKYLHYIVQKSSDTEAGPEITKFKGQIRAILSFFNSHKKEHDNDLILFNLTELGFFASLKISM